MKISACWLAAVWLLVGGVSLSAAEAFVILEDSTGEVPKVVAGQMELVSKKTTPASTFKIVLTWAGLEEKLVTPATAFRCADAHVPGTPRLLTLQQAMFYSSNDYFTTLAGKLGRSRVLAYAEKAGLASPEFSKWLPESLAGVAHAGDLKVSPAQVHALSSRLAHGQLASSPEIQKQLLEAMTWPSTKPEVLVYAKTGTWSGAVWCTGFGGPADDLKAVTVFMPYTGTEWQPVRKQAIEKFYARFGLPAPEEPPPVTQTVPKTN